MGSDPVGVLTGSILGALTGLLGLGLAFAGRRWTAALVHRAELESAASHGAEQIANVPPVDTALVLELLAAQLRAGLAPLAALGALAEALNSRPLHAVCQRLQMGSDWGSAWSGSAAGTFGELRDALAPAYTGGAASQGEVGPNGYLLEKKGETAQAGEPSQDGLNRSASSAGKEKAAETEAKEA